MQGIVSVWAALPVAKKVFLIGAAAATIFAFSLLARTASAPSMALLYAGLDPSAAGEVLAILETMDVETDVRGDAIYVTASQRDSVRMTLAREGQPRQGQAGYELLEDLNGFSTTSDIFDATYWRAKEGELARTILSSPGVRTARVHIARDRAGAFSRHAPKTKAVVTVSMGRGALDVGQAQAIRYLIASAVPDLPPEQVAVIDANQGVILSPGKANSPGVGQAKTADREQNIEGDVLDLLEARVGAGNARVQVTLEIDNEREAITERVLDPNGRVLSGKETTEVTESSSGSGTGAVTVASNLPEGDAAGGGSNGQSERTQTDETVRYDLSEIRREREKLPGAVRRLSVAVLLNHIESVDDTGETIFTARPETEITALRELVSSAVGLDESRGDTLTVQNLPFQVLANTGTVVEKSPVGDFMGRHLMSIIQIGVLSVVTLILGLFVVKPLMSVEPSEQSNSDTAMLPSSAEQVPALEAAAPPDAIETLKELANEKTDETAGLIKSWLDEPEEAA